MFGALFFASAFASACSALLAHEPTQCVRDADCDALGFPHYTCDVPARVCRATTTPAGGASSGGNGGALTSAGTHNGGSPGASGNAGASPLGGGAGVGASSGVGGTRGQAGTAGQGGNPGSAGSAGSAGAIAAGAGGQGPGPIPDWTTLTPPSDGVRIRVRSFCAQPLWLRAVSQSGALSPDDAPLGTGGEVDYDAPANWNGGQVFAYGSAARGVELHEVGASITNGEIFCSLQYLQAFGLPSEVVAFGGNCVAGTSTRSCLAHESDVGSCPETFLKDGARCLSPTTYCSANPDASYCHVFDDAIKNCNGCPGGSTYEVYAGSGAYFPDDVHGAALNRGMTQDPNNTDSSLYYRQAPYNTYAKWVHELCPETVAFTHDDVHSSQSLYVVCNPSELRITLCPAR